MKQHAQGVEEMEERKQETLIYSIQCISSIFLVPFINQMNGIFRTYLQFSYHRSEWALEPWYVLKLGKMDSEM
jgi:hypothetical protein